MVATLGLYRRKRDFTTTPEPKGQKARAAGHSFVIQKHDARRLHYDFRLEMDGVLKSWAVTRGPSLVPGEKRLAVHVEDHPLEYGNFEGTIPKGEYGGGTVIVWDRGTWAPLHDAHKGYAKGHLDFELHGKKLHGRWHLVRMRGKRGEKRENWLLMKGEDEAARAARAPDILEERPDSVKTGRAIKDVAGEPPGWSSRTGKITPAKRRATARAAKAVTTTSRADMAAMPALSERKGVKTSPLPDFIAPTLATLVAKPPEGARWIHEIKFDGYRLQARIDVGRVKFLTRNGLDWTREFGKPIVSALQALPIASALIDGEIVVETATGLPDFSALQADLSEGRFDRFVYYAFDLLFLDGYDLRALPLIERKNRLARLLADAPGTIRYSVHFEESGDTMLRHACRLSLEGIISKQRDASYQSGRSKTWLKSKCSAQQEFVIAGYVPSSTARRSIGSLVLGVYAHGKLQHVGRVGTGFNATVARDLLHRLEKIKTDKSPFDTRLPAEAARGVRYVRPELVAEVDFSTWTADGNLRHASFRGLREDKRASEIVHEVPAPMARATKANTTKANTTKAGTTRARAMAASASQPTAITLTHPDRVYWPDVGVTKEGLADYYTQIWRFIAPFIVGRPLALLRCPGGISGPMFFQKHAWKGLNAHIVPVRDPKDKKQTLISIDDLDGLIGLVQAAVLEIHPWGSTVADWERPDTLTMDLDPGEGVTWDAMIAAAQEARARLQRAGLAAFVKTSGGKGLHVVAPLTPQADWPTTKAFAKALADAMAADSPGKYVSTITKAKRRGKILIDYLRNQRGMTAVAPYSTRARPGAAVSMPLAWEELGAGIGPASFTLMNAPSRMIALKPDPWADFRSHAVVLEHKTPRRKASGKA